MYSIKKALISISLHLCLLYIYAVCPLQAQEHVQSKKIAGWVECAFLEKAGIEMMAKLDSGADNSSINAGELFEFKRDGSNYIRFEIRGFQRCGKNFPT